MFATIAQAIVVSKIRYGIGLFADVRVNDSDPLCKASKDLQLALNKTMRIVTKSRRQDHIRISDLINRTGIQSFNRMSAGDKLMLIWQTANEENSPLAKTIERMTIDRANMTSRARSRGDLRTTAKTRLGQENFPEPGIRLWNMTGHNIREAITKRVAKNEIKTFCDNLPL